MSVCVSDVMAAMERLFPPETAESWDHVGLSVGVPGAPVRTVGFAVDPCEATVNEAISRGADMLITHHPLYLRGTHSVAATTAKGSWTSRLIKSDVALYSAHTNADVAASTVALADLLGVHLERALDEETGIGGVGTIEPVRLAEFGRAVADVLPEVPAGVLVGGDPERVIKRVAICSGSGDSLLDAANMAGADVYLTADLRHHPATDHLWNGGCALVSATHWATEWPLLSIMAERLVGELGDSVDIYISDIPTDAWFARL
ncbi:Nif3-like dinuclear metal center hexameric protein [Ancrocorticia populi]|uniref:Nif3-like dinuclear metal center hexameric protein n=2 Tax=Ancrocorticia populi TaxID=2175228 RepID=UPI002353FEA8|nr:Nif3-like dinuclear metal center hexameric protein [Ancrocorticia populi]